MASNEIETDKYVSLHDALKSVPLGVLESAIATAIGNLTGVEVKANISSFELQSLGGANFKMTVHEKSESFSF